MARVPSGEPLGSNENIAPVVLGVTGSLYLVSFALFAGRICTRLQFRKLGWDDLLFTLGVILALTEWALFLAATQYGAGQHNKSMDLERQRTARQLLFTSSAFHAPSITLLKICIAWMLLRIEHTRRWAIFLWTLIVMQIVSCTVSLAYQLLECVPLDVNWDLSKSPNHHQCAKPAVSLAILCVTSMLGVCFELVLASILILFLRDPRRPLRDRIVVSILACLAIFAAAANIAGTVASSQTHNSRGVLYVSITTTLWRILEEQVAIIAACIPCLNFVFERSLRHLGFLPSIKHSTWPTGTHSSNSDVDMNTHRLTVLRPTCSAMSFTISAKGETAGAETAWPVGGDDVSIRSICALEGGIMKTTEFHIEEEVSYVRDGVLETSPVSWKLGEIPTVQGGWSVV